MENGTIKVRRVGTITFGSVLVAVGTVFLIHQIWPQLAYERILQFWPLILILLGLEILWGCCAMDRRRHKVQESAAGTGAVIEQYRIQYDFAAILMTGILLVFAICMALLDFTYRCVVLKP